MHLPPSGSPRWRAISAPLLDHLRALPGGASWPDIRAWMKRARWSITRATNALAWLEGEGLARSTGGREVVPGLARTAKYKLRRREARVGDEEPVRWHAVARERPAAAPPKPRRGPLPVVVGPAPPAVLPPLRGPFLAGRPASPPPPARTADPGSRDPGSAVEGLLWLPSEDRVLREEVCAKPARIGGRGLRVDIIGGGAPLRPPNYMPPPKTRNAEKTAENRARVRERARVCAPVPEAMRKPLRPPSPARRESHPATCGCAECD